MLVNGTNISPSPQSIVTLWLIQIACLVAKKEEEQGRVETPYIQSL
jgi:hypothetical protein